MIKNIEFRYFEFGKVENKVIFRQFRSMRARWCNRLMIDVSARFEKESLFVWEGATAARAVYRVTLTVRNKPYEAKH